MSEEKPTNTYRFYGGEITNNLDRMLTKYEHDNNMQIGSYAPDSWDLKLMGVTRKRWNNIRAGALPTVIEYLSIYHYIREHDIVHKDEPRSNFLLIKILSE